MSNPIDRVRELPDKWVWTTLGDIAQTSSGGTPLRSRSDFYESGEIPWLKIGDLNDGRVDIAEEQITQLGLDNSSAHVLPKGTLLVAMYGSIGKLGVLGIDAATNQAICAVRVKGPVLRDYLFWFLRSQHDTLLAAGYGGTQANISQGFLKSLPLPLAPSAEQARIVEALEGSLEAIDVGVGGLEVSQHKLANLQTAILTRFTNAQTQAKIIDVGEVYVGATPSREDPEFWNGDIPWVSSGEVAFCRISSTRESITEAGLGNRARRLHPPGTLLLAMIGEGKTRGQAAILDVAAAHNQNSAAIRLNPEMMLPEFLYFCLLLQYERNRRQATGSSQPALNKTRVEQLDVPCPSLAEQRSAVEAVQRSLTVLHQQEQDLERENNLASALKRGVLDRAFSGRLVPQSPTDEPASELLGQVRRQRKSTSGNRRKSGTGLS